MWEAFGHHSRSLWFQARNIYWALTRVRAFPEVFTDPVPLVVLLYPTPLHKSPLVQYLSAYHYQCTHALPSSRCTCYWSALLCNEIVPRMIRTKFRYTSQVSKILLFKNFRMFGWLLVERMTSKIFQWLVPAYWSLPRSVIKGSGRRNNTVSSYYCKRLLGNCFAIYLVQWGRGWTEGRSLQI